MALPYQWQMRVDRLKQMFGGMFGAGGERRPQLCPSCGALVGINATRCHECGANLRFGLAAWSKGLSEFFGGHAPVTVSVLILNVLMFGVSMLRSMHAGGGFGLFGGMNGIELYRLGENTPYIWPGWGPWRLVTGTFLHGGLLHPQLGQSEIIDDDAADRDFAADIHEDGEHSQGRVRMFQRAHSMGDLFGVGEGGEMGKFEKDRQQDKHGGKTKVGNFDRVSPVRDLRVKKVKISQPPMIGPIVVPKELKACERLSRLEAVRSGPRIVT